MTNQRKRASETRRGFDPAEAARHDGRGEAGFSIVEALISTAVLLVVSATVMRGVLGMTDISTTVSNRTDMHNGVRNATELLTQEVGQAGRISLPGRYLVLTPNSERSGVSRRIGQGSERDRMRKLLADLAVPEGMGIIVRTVGESQPVALLRADLKHLLAEWEALKARAAEPGVPGVLRGESDVAERCVRDIMPADVSRVIVDDARRGMVIGFLTREFTLDRGAGAEPMVAVYVPTNHLYLGDVVVYPRGQVLFPDVSVEEGIRIFLTGGMALPGAIRSK